jgi:hypothetical protein
MRDSTWERSRPLVGRGEIRGVDDFFDFRAKPGKPHDSDSWVEMHYGFVYTVQDRLIRRAEAYATPDEALEAAGLRVE